MKRSMLVPAVMVMLCVAPVLLAQRGNGGGGGGNGKPQRERGGNPAQQGSERGSRGARQGHAQDQTARQAADRERIRATEQQRNQIRNLTQSAERIHARAKELKRISKSSRYSTGEVRRLHEELRSETRGLGRECDLFREDLSEEQHTQIQDRLRTIDRSREQMESHLREMKRELAREAPEQQLIAKQARESLSATKEWQKQYRKLRSEMSAN